MPSKDLKLRQNVAGRFYVDEACIDCDLCRVTAPANFTADEDAGHSYVHKQPSTLDEEELCLQAMEECPVEAIGDDGDLPGAGAEESESIPEKGTDGDGRRETPASQTPR